MSIRFDSRAKKFLDSLDEKKQSKTYEYLALFDEYGFGLDTRYLKKVTKDIWELRPGKIRIFIMQISSDILVIHAMHKKSQKITKKTMKTLERRVKEYI